MKASRHHNYFQQTAAQGPRSGFSGSDVEDWFLSPGPLPIIPPSSPYLALWVPHMVPSIILPEAPC